MAELARKLDPPSDPVRCLIRAHAEPAEHRDPTGDTAAARADEQAERLRLERAERLRRRRQR